MFYEPGFNEIRGASDHSEGDSLKGVEGLPIGGGAVCPYGKTVAEVGAEDGFEYCKGVWEGFLGAESNKGGEFVAEDLGGLDSLGDVAVPAQFLV